MTGEQDRWELVTQENVFRQQDIRALLAMHSDIVQLTVFWGIHMDSCKPKEARDFDTAWAGLSKAVEKLPLEDLTLEKEGSYYINKDYWENGTNELNIVHRDNIQHQVQDIWKVM